MSRTYRRKRGNQHGKKWYVSEYVDCFIGRGMQSVEYDRRSHEYRKGLAEYHADRRDTLKEPGPSWYRNLVVERPQRRETMRQLRKAMTDPEFEAVLNAKDPLLYWL